MHTVLTAHGSTLPLLLGYHRGVQELQGPDYSRTIQPQNQLHRYARASQMLSLPLGIVSADTHDVFAVAVGANGSGKSNFFHGRFAAVLVVASVCARTSFCHAYLNTIKAVASQCISEFNVT